MDKGRKLLQDMQQGRLSPKEAIDSCLELVNADPREANLEILVNSLFYAMIEGELLYAAIHEDGPISAAKLIVPKTLDATFYMQTVVMPNGYKVIVIFTGPESLKLVKQTRYLEIGADELFAYIADLEVEGILLNPGPNNYFVPMDIIKALLEQWVEYHRLLEKEAKKK